jgi:hypothetical protein
MSHSPAPDNVTPEALAKVRWHISTRSSSGGGNCVEAGPLNDGTGRVALPPKTTNSTSGHKRTHTYPASDSGGPAVPGRAPSHVLPQWSLAGETRNRRAA